MATFGRVQISGKATPIDDIARDLLLNHFPHIFTPDFDDLGLIVSADGINLLFSEPFHCATFGANQIRIWTDFIDADKIPMTAISVDGA